MKQAFELVHNSDKFIYYITEVVLLQVSFAVCYFSLKSCDGQQDTLIQKYDLELDKG